MFALIIKGNSRFLEDFCCFLPHFLDDFFENLAHFLEEFARCVLRYELPCGQKNAPQRGSCGAGDGGGYEDAQAMRAWAAISWAVSSISVGGVSM